MSFSLMLKYIENDVKFEYSGESFDPSIGLKMLLIVLICGFVITQVGSMCSSLTGGVGINGLVSSVASGMRSTGRMLKSSAKFGGKIAGGIGNAVMGLVGRKGKIQAG